MMMTMNDFIDMQYKVLWCGKKFVAFFPLDSI